MALAVEALCVGMNAGPADAGQQASPRFVGAMLMFLVTGSEGVILVDTGPRDEGWTREHHGLSVERPAELEPVAVLRQRGLEPGDIDVVINTHLHWDHCSNNALFPKATFYVQRDELSYACAPLPVHRQAYEKDRGLSPGWLDVWGRIELVDGDAEIIPGVRVVHLPGHSPGSQGVLVDAGHGPLLIAGDAVNTYAEWHGAGNIPHLPPVVHTSLPDCFASFDKIDELDCEVVPSHDLSLVGRGPFGLS
jgi:N-acyl homoserine lactone hydrolase